MAEPYYKPKRDLYLLNLERLRQETVKTPMDSKRKDVMLASLNMIKALIFWFESLDITTPPKRELNKLTDAIAEYFPKKFYEW